MTESEYTDDTYSTLGTDYTATTDAKSEVTAEENPEAAEPKEEANGEEEEHGAEEHHEEEEAPPPEPEKDPLEGLTYEDDPTAELPQYGSQSFWEERYAGDSEPFEFYQYPDALMPIFKEYTDTEGRVLVLGTGTSEVAPTLAQSGYEAVVAVDYVKPVLKKMRKRFEDLETVQWKMMDIRELDFPRGDFQTVFDKGTLDCLFFNGDEDVLLALTEISRVLKKRGVFICVSYAKREYREKYFDRQADLQLELEKVIELPKPIACDEPHYVYIIRKSSKMLT